MIELKNVVKKYGKKVAVRSASMKVKKNEIICLLGPNGSGKTTLINMICGVTKPSRG